MLILSRKSGETLLINNEIEVKIIEINGDKVKIGIQAPKDVKILRQELRQTMDSNKASATKMSPSKLRNMLSDMKKD
ncbi:MAG: carbon storage regulator CsrA [Oscillospiraceae bacterium]|nr:carbon storage regulator CsrA [Oscillospiraceae bacterium]